MKKLYSLLLLLTPLLSVAQTNYKAGYVINTKGDTLHGYINYHEWNHNPVKINFKTAPNEKAARLGVNDISCFVINGFEIYQRYVVHASLDAVNMSNASTNGADTTTRTDTVFMKVLQTGKNITLYAYEDAVKNRFYIKDNAMATPQELVYRIYFEPENPTELVTKTTFRRQLLVVSANLGLHELTNQIQELKYDQWDLIKICGKINGLNDKQIKNSSHNAQTHFFAGGGLSSNALTFEGQSPFPNAKPATSTSEFITVGIDNYINPNVGRIVLRAELGYTANNFLISSPSTYSAQSANTQLFTQYTIALMPQFIYNIFNTNKLKVFAGVGAVLSQSFYPTNNYTQAFPGGTGYPYVTTRDNYPEYRGINFEYLFKAGVHINKKFEVYANYIPPAMPVTNNYTSFSGNLTTLQIGFSYFWGKR